jgi:hypothetical protein
VDHASNLNPKEEKTMETKHTPTAFDRLDPAKFERAKKALELKQIQIAAPDLLAACERLLIWRQKETPIDLLEQAEAVIAKAKGLT